MRLGEMISILIEISRIIPNFGRIQREMVDDVQNERFRRWPENEAQGIVIPEDDGTAEGEVPSLSGKAEKERKKQLHSWFKNYGQKVKKRGDIVAPSKASTLALRLFKRISKRRRRLQVVEIFQKRNSVLVDTAVKLAMDQFAGKKAKKQTKKKKRPKPPTGRTTAPSATKAAVVTTAAAAATMTTAVATHPSQADSRRNPQTARWIIKRTRRR
ncbi:hypothetical protein B0H14DRAFT_3610867 [Mycena olivaceomarginata]|nr:hypothetical protein B0H14DRAFT_3610867 [Mycena olivaceomarginata]